MSTRPVLDDDQRFKLMKFRRTVSDVTQSHHDDEFLLRWLRARSWDIEAAEKMLRQSLKWRLQWEIDGALRTWQPPEVITRYLPYGLAGVDKGKAPIIVVPFAGFDPMGMLQSAGSHDLVKIIAQSLESNLELAQETGARKVSVIFDMDNFNLRHYAHRPVAEFVISVLKMYEANYPEILKNCYIINAPRVFAIAFNVVKKFLNEYTLSKIQIFKNEPKKWKQVLLENIDADNLPKYLGGSMTDPDGNPRCVSKICQGGKVPKSYYTRNLQVDNPDSDKDYETVVIKKGDKFTLDLIAAEDGCFLRWDFHTDGHDIKFGITMKDVDDNVSFIVRHRRIATHKLNETGAIACQSPATYTITFDNSYSLFRSKKVHYKIYIAEPLEKLGLTLDDQVDDAKTQEAENHNGEASNSTTHLDSVSSETVLVH